LLQLSGITADVVGGDFSHPSKSTLFTDWAIKIATTLILKKSVEPFQIPFALSLSKGELDLERLIQ